LLTFISVCLTKIFMYVLAYSLRYGMRPARSCCAWLKLAIVLRTIFPYVPLFAATFYLFILYGMIAAGELFGLF